MIVKIHNGPDSKEEFCLLEFQGEMVGELAGNELGQIVIKEVRTIRQPITHNIHA
jgi:hypothetical protein